MNSPMNFNEFWQISTTFCKFYETSFNPMKFDEFQWIFNESFVHLRQRDQFVFGRGRPMNISVNVNEFRWISMSLLRVAFLGCGSAGASFLFCKMTVLCNLWESAQDEKGASKVAVAAYNHEPTNNFGRAWAHNCALCPCQATATRYDQIHHWWNKNVRGSVLGTGALPKRGSACSGNVILIATHLLCIFIAAAHNFVHALDREHDISWR